MGTLCDSYGIPDKQRAQCATRFTRSELRTELENVLRDARDKFGSVGWAQFTVFMVGFDREQYSVSSVEPFTTEILQVNFGKIGRVSVPLLIPRWLILMSNRIALPFYKKHPKRTGAALGIAGGVLLAPVAVAGTLTVVGFTSGGVAAGNVVLYLSRGISY